MKQGSPRRSRYKYGKIQQTVGLDKLQILMKRVVHVNRAGYSVEFIQALIALFYWTGLRRSEVLGDKGHKWMTKKGLKTSDPFPGLLKEDLSVDDQFLYVQQVARKHGKREAPLAIPLELPYVNLIVTRWQAAGPNRKVFPISYVTFWRILKRIDPKLYPHYFRFNRITKFAKNPKTSIAQICTWTGLNPITVSRYLFREGRFSRELGKMMIEET